MKTNKDDSNGAVTIIWQPDLCIHCGFCAKGQPNVFKPKEKPWINPNGAAGDAIVNQVKQCPSGALSFRYNQQKKEDE